MRTIRYTLLSLSLLLTCARKDKNDPLFLLPFGDFGTRQSEQPAIVASETIGPEGGELRTDDGLVVTFPSGALTEPVAIHVVTEVPQNVALPKGDSVSTIYRLTPAMRFKKEITVAVPDEFASSGCLPFEVDRSGGSGETLELVVLADIDNHSRILRTDQNGELGCLISILSGTVKSWNHALIRRERKILAHDARRPAWSGVRQH